MNWLEWYNSLVKPDWTPAPGTIGTIWQILYPIILGTFGYVFMQFFRGKVTGLVALPFLINLLSNLVFTPIQFGMRNMPLASVDIMIIWTSIIWLMIAIWPYHRWVAIAQLPYLTWVSIATVLQISITLLNWEKN